jgi:hypothetical protein
MYGATVYIDYLIEVVSAAAVSPAKPMPRYPRQVLGPACPGENRSHGNTSGREPVLLRLKPEPRQRGKPPPWQTHSLRSQ